MEDRRNPAVVAWMDLLGRLNMEVFTGRMSTLRSNWPRHRSHYLIALPGFAQVVCQAIILSACQHAACRCPITGLANWAFGIIPA